MNDSRTVAIVGGGISGSLTALHLGRLKISTRIIVIEPAPSLGLGLAYSTPSLEHLLNVPAGKMTLLPEEPDHFLEWLHANHDESMSREDFAPRAVFGRYMQSLLRGASGIEHLQAVVVDRKENTGRRSTLVLASGQTLQADLVVLATGNFLPATLRGVSDAAHGSGVYCHSAWESSTYSGIDSQADVILIGSGLTAVDVWLRLRELGHQGRVKMLSRHGMLPHPHAPYLPLSGTIIEGTPPTTARELLRQVHRAIQSGIPWRAVVDSLRVRTNELWLSLSLAEQRRFKRHLQRRWDVVRHRMAPSIAERIKMELAVNSVEVIAGTVLSVDTQGEQAIVQIRSRDGALFQQTAARVINCTGPNMNYSAVESELLRNLLGRGEICAGPLGYGLWSDAEGALRTKKGTYSQTLYNIGPGRQGVLLESIAVPELRMQAVELAQTLAAKLKGSEREEQKRSEYSLSRR